MRAKNFYIQCPQCKKKINFSKALHEWQDITGEIILPGYLYYTIRCSTCKDQTVVLLLQPGGEEETIAEIFDKPVKIKKPKKLVN